LYEYKQRRLLYQKTIDSTLFQRKFWRSQIFNFSAKKNHHLQVTRHFSQSGIFIISIAMPVFLIPLAAAGYVYYENRKRIEAEESDQLPNEAVTVNKVFPNMQMSNVSDDETQQGESDDGIEIHLERSQHESGSDETQELSEGDIPSERPKRESLGPIASFRKFLRKHGKSANTRDQYRLVTRKDGTMCLMADGSDESIPLPKISFK
jgi:hypothetical protein